MNLGIGFWLGGLIVLGGGAAFTVGIESAARFGGPPVLLAFGLFEMCLGGALIWEDWKADRRP